ncbi:flagellin [Magnetofaba australis]|uniref:Flagellin n=1 Tax=Magnetofaba australis IT-1 TaxID=1434232 RepID=A0A1Y2K3T9_9PROT|nr:flagellin [Magnetofaba australis]OSM03926.1 putative flagellin domain-containing protein [Magnetofaba australis IT-1]
MFSINTNVQAIRAQRSLSKVSTDLSTTFQRLSSGVRINSAADDAAGLSIATRMSAQIRGLNMAARNANDAISLVQVAEGALDETTNALQRMRELAVQSANGTLTTTDRTNLNTEFTQLASEINRISSATQYNGKTLLSVGGYSGKIQVGAYSGQKITFQLYSATATALQVKTLSIGGNSALPAQSAISVLDNALNSVSSMRATLGAVQNRFESVIANLNNQAEQQTAAQSRIMDADIASETANLTRLSILQQAGTAILAQANQQPALALSLLG